jgi:hypothetical protein
MQFQPYFETLMQGSKESAAIAAYTSGGFWPGKP